MPEQQVPVPTAYAWLCEVEIPPNAPWGVSWGLDCAWAHPAWSQYVIHLYDLTTPTEKPPFIHLPGATHEFMLWAVDPNVGIVRDAPGPKFFEPGCLLDPANLGYQFIASSHAAARSRLQALINKIVAGTLSPDTDFRRMWDSEFADGMTLLKRAM